MHVHCVCPPEIAATRFANRKRHDGHLDSFAKHEDVLSQLRVLAALPPIEIGERIEIDTSAEIDVNSLAWKPITTRSSA